MKRLLLLYLGWTVFGVAAALMETMVRGARPEAVKMLLAYHLPVAWWWALMTPAIGAWSRGLRSRASNRLARTAAHLPAIVLAAVLVTVVRRALSQLVTGIPPSVPFEASLLYFADLTVGSYLVALWAARAMEKLDQLRASEAQTRVLEQQLASAQLEYLELQLRPHFLFNALGTVAELAHEAPKNAAKMLKNIISLLEGAVARQGRGLVSLDEELRAVQPYVAIQQARFSDWLEIEVAVSDAARRALVPQLLLQPLVENAVHHGLRDRRAFGRILIQGTVSDSRLRLAVIDNGVGLDAETYRERRGLGLANIRGRLAAVYGADAGLQLSRDGETGTAAILDLPIRTAQPHAQQTRAAGLAPVAPQGDSADRLDHLYRWAQRHSVAAVVAAWTIIALLRIEHSYAYLSLRGRYSPDTFGQSMLFDAGASILWMPLTGLVFWLSRRFPLRDDTWKTNIALHLAAAMAIALAHAAIVLFLTQEDGFRVWSPALANSYGSNVLVYGVLLLLAHLGQLERWLSEKENAAERLRAQLHRARFNQLMVELRPAILIETLEEIVQIIGSNSGRAETLLSHVGSFLRRTLDTITEDYVTLRQELDCASDYGRVLSVVAAPGLELEISVAAGIQEELVPRGFLRTAIDSVLEQASTLPTRVRMDATRDGARLAFEFLADGAGRVRSVIHPLRDGLSTYVEHGGLSVHRSEPGRLLIHLTPTHEMAHEAATLLAV